MMIQNTPEPRPMLEKPMLDRSTLDRMHQAALEILERTGLRVEHDEIRAELAKRNGFTFDGDRVLISPNKCNSWAGHQRERSGAEKQCRAIRQPADLPHPYTYGVSDRNTFIVERDGTTLRPSTRDDVIAGARLLHVLASQGVQGSTPCMPCDVPVALRPIEQYMIGAEYSGAGGHTSHICDIATAGIIREMNRVYGRAFHQSIWCPSPLVFGGPELGIFWHFRKEVDLAGVGTMPMMGINGPCDPIGIFTLSIAECMGGAAILHELLPDMPMIIAPHPEPADMRTGSIVFGTPEWDLLDLMHRDIYEYYGERRDAKMLHTSVSLPNAQVQIERARSAMLGVLYGYTNFEPLGQIGLDEVWSPAQLMLDMEMIAEAARIAQGIESAPGLELDALPAAVDEVVRGGVLFAEHETTLSNFRTQYRRPDILQRIVRQQWEAAGRPDVLQDAFRRADALTASYQYEPPAALLRALRAIHNRARSLLANV